MLLLLRNSKLLPSIYYKVIYQRILQLEGGLRDQSLSAVVCRLCSRGVLHRSCQHRHKFWHTWEFVNSGSWRPWHKLPPALSVYIYLQVLTIVSQMRKGCLTLWRVFFFFFPNSIPQSPLRYACLSNFTLQFIVATLLNLMLRLKYIFWLSDYCQLQNNKFDNMLCHDSMSANLNFECFLPFPFLMRKSEHLLVIQHFYIL